MPAGANFSALSRRNCVNSCKKRFFAVDFVLQEGFAVDGFPQGFQLVVFADAHFDGLPFCARVVDFAFFEAV